MSGMQTDQAFCRYCKAAILRRYCGGCKDLVPDFTKTCPYCGTPSTHKPPESKLPEWIKISAAAVVLFVVAILISMPDQDTVQAQLPKASSVVSDNPIRKVNSEAAPAPKPELKTETDAPPPAAANNTAAPDVDLGIRLNVRGHYLVKQNRFDEAIPLLRRAIEAFPKDTDNIAYYYAQYNLGYSLRRIGKPAEAIPYLERCVAFDKNNPMFVNELQIARSHVKP